jgi:hypothetical protein
MKDRSSHVDEIAEKCDVPLSIACMRLNGREYEAAAKRYLATIDMESVAKQALMNSLNSFFNKDAEQFFRSNGTLYRRGYLLYGPDGHVQWCLDIVV